VRRESLGGDTTGSIGDAGALFGEFQRGASGFGEDRARRRLSTL